MIVPAVGPVIAPERVSVVTPLIALLLILIPLMVLVVAAAMTPRLLTEKFAPWIILVPVPVPSVNVPVPFCCTVNPVLSREEVIVGVAPVKVRLVLVSVSVL